MKRSHRLRKAALLFALSCSTSATWALTFNFTSNNHTVATDSNAYLGFQAAANIWSSLLTDDVTVTIDIGFTSLASGILGQAGSTRGVVDYTSFVSAANTDQSSVFDEMAVDQLKSDYVADPDGTFDSLINRTADNPNGAGSATTYVDADDGSNNYWVNLTTANAAALGLSITDDWAIYAAGGYAGVYAPGYTGVDAAITFSSSYVWDFNSTDGISGFDFVGVAAHEIGHALGFISGVDVLDYNSPNGTTYYSDNQFSYVTPLDFFRYSDASAEAGVMDWTANNTAKFFSLDGGDSAFTYNGKTAYFATGVNHGDGRQASHWRDNLGLGIMDPTTASGEFLQVSALDAVAFDVIGWDVNWHSGSSGSNDVPAPTTIALLCSGIIGFAAGLRRRRPRNHN